jgi:hypothetical protein
VVQPRGRGARARAGRRADHPGGSGKGRGRRGRAHASRTPGRFTPLEAGHSETDVGGPLTPGVLGARSQFLPSLERADSGPCASCSGESCGPCVQTCLCTWRLRQAGSQALDLGRRAWVLNLRAFACGPPAALPRRAVRGIVRHPGSGVTRKGSPIANDIMSGVRGPAIYSWLQGPANVRERDPHRCAGDSVAPEARGGEGRGFVPVILLLL